MSRRSSILKRWIPVAGAITAVALAGLLLAQVKDKALYVVTHVDVSPATSAETAKAVLQLAAESRKDPGCVRFEVLQSTDRVNHFEVLEVWRTRRDFEAHEGHEHTRQFREKIQAGLGSPLDERLYYALE
jgi:quinol monooxygenase YgiN